MAVLRSIEPARRLLVVVDERGVRTAVVDALAPLGYAVTTSGRTDIDAAEGPDADLVLLDLGMPDERGLQLLEVLAQRGLPVLTMSRDTGPGGCVVPLELGAV